MRVALIYPPVADPTMPYVALPLLTAVLRRAGHEVLPIDANALAIDHLLSGPRTAELAARVRERFARLDARSSLTHAEQLAYVRLWEALPAAAVVPGAIEEARAVLRDPVRFYDPRAYGRAADLAEAALELASAAYTPLDVSLRGYRTPFSWLTPGEIARDAEPDRDPFAPWTAEVLLPRLVAARVDAVGLSIAFPGQLQPAWSLATAVRAELPDVLLLAGGPALSQRLLPLPEATRRAVLGPFDAAVLGEGETTLPRLLEQAARGDRPHGTCVGEPVPDLASVPPPDYDGLDLAPYLAPEPVLPYDATRGCYWGRCAFCHYGPVAHGTASYRERPLDRVVADLAGLRSRGARVVYLSHDTLAPRLAFALADRLRAEAADVRWACDVRPEPALAGPGAVRLAAGGALAFSLGVESGCQRVLGAMEKGTRVEVLGRVARDLAAAGVAVEAMTFTDFPGETRAEALDTLRWLELHHDAVALFVCGTFALTAGAKVAEDPARFGLAETWRVAGDELGTGLFWREAVPSKTDADREAVDAALERLGDRWRLRPYPWAGSLSTAHTLLWYARFGADVFRQGGTARPSELRRPRGERAPRYDVDALAERSEANEAALWGCLIHEERRVSRDLWRRLADRLPRAMPRAARMRAPRIVRRPPFD